MLVPLLLLPALERRWRSVALALVPVVVLSALAIALNSQTLDFFHKTLPFLLKGDPNFFRIHNASLAGAGINLGIPGAPVAVLRLLVGVAALWLALVRWRESDPAGGPQFLRVVDTSSLLLLGTFLCFSIAWPYYDIYLIPLLATIGSDRSLVRHPLSLVGVLLVGAPDVFAFDRFHRAVTHFNEVRPTLGFACLLAGMGMTLVARTGGRLPRPWTRQAAPVSSR